MNEDKFITASLDTKYNFKKLDNANKALKDDFNWFLDVQLYFLWEKIKYTPQTPNGVVKNWNG